MITKIKKLNLRRQSKVIFQHNPLHKREGYLLVKEERKVEMEILVKEVSLKDIRNIVSPGGDQVNAKATEWVQKRMNKMISS